MDFEVGPYDEPSAAATHAADILLKNFDFFEKPESRVKATPRNLALLIDVCTNVFRLERVIGKFVRQTPWLDKNELARNLDMLREGIRAVELVYNRTPRFGNEDKAVPFSTKRSVEREVSAEMRRNMAHISGALRGAKTIEEEQRILKAAGIVR